MPYRYLRDPLFVVCFLTYWVHRWLAAHDMSTPLLRGYLNDLICIPFWVPIMLWVQRTLRLRRHDAPPDAVEIGIPLLIISVLFEVVLPSQRTWHVPTVADPYDVLSYCVGALVAVIFWRWYYGRRRPLLTARQDAAAEHPAGHGVTQGCDEMNPIEPHNTIRLHADNTRDPAEELQRC